MDYSRGNLDNHQRPIWDAGFDAGKEANAMARTARQNRRRRAFIRQAAIMILATAPHDAVFTHGDAWQLARSLWDAKPEDC